MRDIPRLSAAVYAFRALLVQAHSGVQVNEHYIFIVYTLYIHAVDMYVQITYSYVHCTYMYMLLISVIMFCPDGLKSSSKRLLLCQMLQGQKRPSTLIQQFWYYHWYICIQYMVPMYSVCTRHCIYTVCTCICNICACFNQLSKQPFLGGI